MPKPTLARRFYRRLVDGGFRGVCVAVFERIGRRLHLIKPAGKGDADGNASIDKSLIHTFDLKYGTDTSGIIPSDMLHSVDRNNLWSTAYYGVSPSVVNQALAALDLDWPRFTFLDLGSGKGRALLLASRFPFRGIIGMEIVPELNEVATANIARFSAPWQQCREIEARNGDVAACEYPAGPVVLYMYHPFLAPVFRRCLRNLSRSLAAEPREVYLIYVNPILEKLIQKHAPMLERQWERTFTFTPEDVQGSIWHAVEDSAVVYRYLPQR